MYYFASDTHLGLETGAKASERERRFVRWLDEVSADARAIFLVGDIFDFWYEYRRVVPKGFTRLLGKLSELTDRGVEIHFFGGNHDLWTFDYLRSECGVILHHGSVVLQLAGQNVFIDHGDTLGPRRIGSRLLSRIFRSRTTQWLFSHLLHPDLALHFGHWWSRVNRYSRSVRHEFREESEPAVQFAREYLRTHDVDLFVCGHIHCAEIFPLNAKSRIAFLGEWIENPVYGVLSPEGFSLKPYVK